MSRGPQGTAIFAPEAIEEYVRCATIPGTVHAFCEDYRASAGIDLDHDRADRAAGRKVECPLRVFWGRDGAIEKCFKAMEIWPQYARQVEGRAFPCGHYIPEEQPELLTEELLKFF